MNTSPKPRHNLRTVIVQTIIVLFTLAWSGSVQAAARWWDGGTADNPGTGDGASSGGLGAWNTTTLNWDPGAGLSYTNWANAANDNAIFGGTGDTVTLGTLVQANSLEFDAPGYTLTGQTVMLTGATPMVTNSADVTIASALSIAAATTKSGSGKLTLSGLVTNTGGMTINQGTVAFNFSSRPGWSTSGNNQVNLGTVSVPAGSILELNDVNNVLENLLFAGGTVVSGSGTINKTGVGQIEFWNPGSTPSSISNFTGQINVVAGVLGNNGSDWASGPGLMSLDIAAGAFFDMRTGNLKIDRLTGSGTVTNSYSGGPGTLIVGNNGGTSTFSGAIINGQSARSFVKNGGGTQTLTGTNTYTGATAISAGGLTLDGAGLLGSGSYGGVITNNATLTYNSSAAQAFSGALTGAGTLIKSGTGNLTLSGASPSYGGSIALKTGKLYVNGSLGASALLTVASGTTLGGSGGIASAVTVSNNAAIETGSGAGVGVLSLGTLVLGSQATDASSIIISNVSTSARLVATNLIVNSSAGLVTIKVFGSFSTGQFPLVSNPGGTLSGSFSAFALALPTPNVVASLVNNTASNTVDLLVTSAGGIVWSGANSTEWSTNTLTPNKNWAKGTIAGSPTDFYPGDAVTFDDSLTGTSTVDMPINNVNPGAVLFNNSATNYSVTGTFGITGGASLTKTGTGTVALRNSGANTLGAVNVSRGSLVISNTAGNTLGGVTVTNATLTQASAGASTLGAVTVNNAGTLLLDGAGTNSATSVTIGTGGTLQIGNADAQGTLTGVAISDNGTILFNRTDNLSYGSVISGSGRLTKNGSGTLTLTGSHTFSGGSIINQGTLKVDLTGTIQGYSVRSNAVGSILELTSVISSIDAAGGTISSSNSVFAGTGTINKTGAGYLGLWGSGTGAPNIKSFAGQINVVTGTFASNGSDWPSSPGLMNLDVASGANFDLRTGNVNVDKLTGAGTIGTTYIQSPVLSVGNNNGSSTFNGQIINSITALSGYGGYNAGGKLGLTKNGSGTLTLNGINTYSNATTVNGGKLWVNGSLAAASVVTVNTNATLGGSGTVSGPVTLMSGGTLAPGTTNIGTLNLANNLTMNPGSTNLMRIDKTSGIVAYDTVAGVNTLTYGGTLVVTNITSDGFQLALGDTFYLYNANSRLQTFAKIVLPTNNLPAGLSWDTTGLASSGSISVANLTSAPIFTPPPGNYGYALSVTLSSLTPGATNYYSLNNWATTNVYTGPVSLPLNTTNTIRAYAVAPGMAPSAEASATYLTVPTATWVGGGFNSDGSWAITASWSNNFTADGVGVTADFSAQTVVPGFGNNANVTLDGSWTVGRMIFGDLGNSYGWDVEAGAGGTLTLAATNTPVILVSNQTATIGAVLTGSSGLAKTGPGTLILTGGNTYSGGTVVANGTLQIGNATVNGSIGSGAYGIASSARLYLDYATAAAPPWASTSGAGTLEVNSAQGANGSADWGTVSLPGAFTGTLQVDKGRFDGVNSSLGGAGSVVVENGAQFLAFNGSAGSYTFSNNFSINGLGWGEGIYNNGALRVSVLSATFNGGIALTGDSALYSQQDQPSSQITVNGPISGGFNLTINNSGAQPTTLNGTNTYTGDTTVSGTLIIGGAGSLDNGSYAGNIPMTTALIYASSASQILSGSISGTGATLTKSGSSTLTLAGASTYSGATVVSNGTLLVNGSIASTVSVSSAGRLGGTGSIGGSVTNNGTLSPGASIGTLNVSGSALLNGVTYMEVDRSALPANDVLSAASVAYGGTLTVTNLGAAFQSGDSFQLVAAGSYTGDFAALNLPPLNPGLAWSWNVTNGTLSVLASVATNPTNITFSVSSGNLNLSWPADHLGWRLETQTNPRSTGLSNNWATVPGSTSITSTNFPLNPANPTVFYRLVYP
jgi:autotransporter-associated beta strand protein